MIPFDNQSGVVGFGGNINQYIMSAFIDSFNDLGQFVPAFTKAAIEATLSLEAGIVIRMDTQAFKTMTDLKFDI